MNLIALGLAVANLMHKLTLNPAYLSLPQVFIEMFVALVVSVYLCLLRVKFAANATRQGLVFFNRTQSMPLGSINIDNNFL